VLRAWSERSGHRAVVVHPESHLAYDEDGALEQLHPIRAVRLGGPDNFTVEELDKVGEPLAAVSVELPLRRAGFRLPSWDELTAISSWCNERDLALHLDGARLWEAQTYYDRPLDEIAGLADSVYVSFYKGLGGLAGCAIAAESQLLDAASPWIARLGGPVFSTYPYALGAIQGLDERLPRMGAYHKRAVQLAQALEGVDGVIVERPKATGFRLHLHGEPELLRSQHRAVAEDTKMWLFGFIGPSPVVGYAVAEVQIGESSFELTDEEIRSALERIMAVEE
jgi:threonine aldolase